MESKTIYKIVGVVLLSVMLQSCFVAKQYTRPQLDTHKLYRNVTTTDSSTLGQLKWKELFTDTHLQLLIDEALENNLDLKMAMQRVNAAQAYYKQGKAGYLPTLSLQATGGKVNVSDRSFSGVAAGGNGPSYDNYQLNGVLSWEADIWGKIRSGKRATQASLLQSEAGYRAVQTRLIASMASAYYQLVALDAQWEITHKTVLNRAESLQTMKDLKKAGRVTQAAVKQTEAQWYSAQLLQLNLEQNIELLENTMSLMLGHAPKKIERGSLDQQSVIKDMKTGIPAQLLRNRPDVMAAEWGLVKAFENTNVARSSMYPSISINVSGGWESTSFENWFSTSALFSRLTGGLVQPLLNKRQNRTRLEVAKAQQMEAMLGFQKTLLASGKEVSDALFSYQKESKKVLLRQKEVESLTLAVNYSQELLNNGYATYLEVLTARDHALASEIGLIDSRFKQLNAVVNLYQALGGGWK